MGKNVRWRGARLENILPELKTILPNSDFVIEGYVDPIEPLRDEGPCGDHGYYTLPEPYTVFHVTAITHRKDAVYPATIEVQEKVAIVTGAASGIGRATVELLHARGALVVAEDINPAVKDIFKGHDRIVPFVGDVASEETARSVVALTLERFGKLDILVNNAATIIYKRVVDMTLDEWDRILSVNLTGVFLHSREAVRAMIPKKSGAIATQTKA
jgi:hypothetical protein